MSAAMDKNYIDVFSDSLIKKAVDYYSLHKDLRHKMLAYYYHGIVLKNGQQFPSAIIAFEKAEKEAILLKDYYQLGLIYRNKATVFSLSNNVPEAIKNWNKAILNFKQAQTPLYQTYAELSLATDYINNQEFDIADSLLTAINETNTDINPNLQFKCNIRKAAILINKGAYPEQAIDYYRRSPKKYYSILDYSYYALAAESLGQKDTADYWISLGYTKCKDKADSASLDYMKSRIALRRGQYVEAYYLIDEALNVQDSLTRILLQQSVSGAQRDFFKAETARQDIQLKEAQNKRMRDWIIGFLVALTCIIGFIDYSREKDRQLQEQIARLVLERNKSDRANRENAHLLGSLYSARLAHIDQLSQIYFSSEDKQQKEKTFKQIKQIVLSIRNNPEIFLSLENDLNRYCNGIISKLREQVPRIKGDNLHIITLFFAGFSYEVVQIIMNRSSVNSLKMARTRFRKEIISAKAPDEALFLDMLEMKKRSMDNNTNENADA